MNNLKVIRSSPLSVR